MEPLHAGLDTVAAKPNSRPGKTLGYETGWWMYVVRRGNILILMLGGGTEATQDRDIIKAIALAETIVEP